MDVLDKNLAEREYMAGDAYTIADIAIYPWYGTLVQGKIYDDSATFLDAASYKNLNRWVETIKQRPAVERGRRVNRTWGEESEQLRERHSASDIDATFG